MDNVFSCKLNFYEKLRLTNSVTFAMMCLGDDMKKKVWVRNAFFAIAALIMAAAIAYTLNHAMYMWENESKFRSFRNFVEYYFTAFDATLLLTFLVAAAIVGLGILIQRSINKKSGAS